MLLKAAGTRPEPAVSVPSAKLTSPAATATAEPELEPPGMKAGSNGLRGDAVGRAHADQPGGELVEIGLADQDRAGGEQPLDRGGRRAGHVGELRAGGGGRQAGDVDIVLDRERHAPERAALGCRHRLELSGPGPQLGLGTRAIQTASASLAASRGSRRSIRLAGVRLPAA